MIQSGGVLKKSRLWTPLDWNGIPQPGITQAFRWGSYESIYRSHLWPSVLVNKIANAAARLPLKVYERDDNNGRNEARGHPYSELLKRPHPTIDPYSFWLWVVSTLNVYGEAFLIKDRDRSGHPRALVPYHPDRWDYTDGKWTYQDKAGNPVPIKRRNFVHFKFWDPTQDRGMSPLEPLRWTLENEEGSRRANSAQWRNGAKPSVLLKHPGNLSENAQQRLKANWDAVHAGADNFAKTAVLEEGMEAQLLSFNPEEMAYITTRQLNREEVCAAYDVPPPVVHILDRATFSNITEQMRSMYRDTMAPKLKLIESTLETELRDGRMGAVGDPTYSDNVYAEFLMDEVLRGSFEARTTAIAQGIQTGQMTPAEARKLENRPFIDGSDVLLINSAVMPVDQAAANVPNGGSDPKPSNVIDLPNAASFNDDPVVRRHMAGIEKRMAELGEADG
jgi:HK97 family phage portal protein